MSGRIESNSLCGTPVLTCNKTISPIYKLYSPAYLPITNSYVFLPFKADSTEIDPDRVFTVLFEVLKGERKLSNCYVPLKDRKEFEHYEWYK